MAAYRKPITADNVEKYIQEGYGQGEYENYKPWIETHHLSSKGRSIRYHGQKIERTHQLLSQAERDYLMHQEYSLSVVDIREQYPLLPLVTTVYLAQQLKIEHPAHAGIPLIMTTDAVLTVQTAQGLICVPRSIKYQADLQNKRTFDLLRLEQAYWRYGDLMWANIIADNIPKSRTQNLKCVLPYYRANSINIPADKLRMVKDELTSRVIASPLLCLDQIATVCDDYFDIPIGTTLNVAKHLIARQIWRVNIDQRLNFSKPLTILSTT